MVTAKEAKPGTTVEYEGEVWVVRDRQHVKPGKGSPYVRMKLQKVIGKGVIETSFDPDDKFNQARIDKADYQYLYKDDDFYYFMNQTDYEQVQLSTSDIAENMKFVKENDIVKLTSYKGNFFAVEPEITVELEVTETEPGVKGNTATNATKPATLETGATLNVPLFINIGDRIKVDTRDGQYISRA